MNRRASVAYAYALKNCGPQEIESKFFHCNVLSLLHRDTLYASYAASQTGELCENRRASNLEKWSTRSARGQATRGASRPQFGHDREHAALPFFQKLTD